MKKLGFGFMRLPMLGENVDIEQTKAMVDRFMADGFTYFDTAHLYIEGKSELALKEALTKRYPRESYQIADKLTWSTFEDYDSIVKVFGEQLDAVGVDYFDYYLLHAMGKGNREKYENAGAYEFCAKMKAEGKIKHFGMSFHDSPEVLDSILTAHPETEFVQLQFNYIDYDSPRVRSRECLDVCRKHGKPVIVMEPVKGGRLANLPRQAHEVLASLGDGMSDASYAVRFAASFDDVFMVLSGMSNTAQLDDNCSVMKDFRPLDEREKDAIRRTVEVCRQLDVGLCTGCKYCVDGCPQNIMIPGLMDAMNKKRRHDDEEAAELYAEATANNAPASACIGCGQCESVCPQKLRISEMLPDIAKAFEV